MTDELRPDYEFDYRQAEPNRFAAGLEKGIPLVMLEPEVAEITQPLDPTEDDDLTSELLESNPAFRSLVERTKESPRKPFPPGPIP